MSYLQNFVVSNIYDFYEWLYDRYLILHYNTTVHDTFFIRYVFSIFKAEINNANGNKQKAIQAHI